VRTLPPIEAPSADSIPHIRLSRTGSASYKRLLRAWSYYVALIPTFVLLALFGYYPAINGLYHAFYDWEPAFYAHYIGLDNFRTMLHDTVFINSLKNVAQFFIFGVTLAWLLPILAAEAVITLHSQRWQFIFRTLLIAPFAFPIAVQVLLWGFLYDPNVGVFNSFLRAIGLGGLAHNWLGDPHTALFSLMFMNAPWVASVPFLIFLSGLQGIPQEIFDSAALEGAGRFRRFFLIDLPLLASQFKLMFILAIIQILQFAVPVALLTNGGPANSTMMPVVYLLDTAFNGSDWGYAAALSATLFMIMLVLSLVVFRLTQPRSKPATT
jgi:raffinose/stachyose/melibiose transport system permease protein